MEYVAGRSLKTIVREQGALDPAAAIDIVVQILRGARFAHKRGVVHRDLKPHNVILDEEGRARVTDFGIARAGASDMTLTGLDHGHRPVPLPRAGPGPRRERRLGPVLGRGHPVRAADRRRPVRGRDRGGDRVQAGLGRAAAAERASTRRCRRRSTRSCCARSRRTRRMRYADAEEFIAALQQERRGSARLAGRAARARVPAAGRAPTGTGPLLLPAADPLARGARRPAHGSPPARAAVVRAVAVLDRGWRCSRSLLLAGGGRVRVPDVVGLTEQAALVEAEGRRADARAGVERERDRRERPRVRADAACGQRRQQGDARQHRSSRAARPTTPLRARSKA